jgi:hypothetical protein
MPILNSSSTPAFTVFLHEISHFPGKILSGEEFNGQLSQKALPSKIAA